MKSAFKGYKMDYTLIADPLTTTIHDLPDEDIIITHIGKYLSPKDILALRCCSKDFARIGVRMLQTKKVIYKNTQMEDKNWNLDDLKLCRCLRKVTLYSTQDVTDDFLIALVANNPKIQEVSLRRASKITKKGLEALLQLQNLTGLRLINTECNQDFLQCLSQKMLDHIYLTVRYDLTIDNLMDFFGKQSNLRHISLDFQKNADDSITRSDTTENLDLNLLVHTIAKACSKLRYFIIQRDRQAITEQSIRMIFENCDEIQFISVSRMIQWAKGQPIKILISSE